ncbi:MAG: hypothetical protein WAN87_00565 [Thermoplasmata archaeon]
MAGRSNAPSTSPGSLRVEVLKELQSMIDDRDARDRIDRGPLAETKGREHWVLHLLLRAQELNQSHVDVLIGSAYSNLTSRLQTLEDRLLRIEELCQTLDADTKSRFQSLEKDVGTRLKQELAQGFENAGRSLNGELGANLETKWKQIGDSIETFSQSSRQLTKDLADTYRVATQTRLLLNENARRITDLGRDIVALEESLKLVIARTIEETLAPLEQRVATLETHAKASETPPSEEVAEEEVEADVDPNDVDPASDA